MKILDCTLRDGGYYTNWDFDQKQVDQYITALNDLPIDYIEIGYRSPLQKAYHGKYFYLPLYELQHLRQKSNKKLVIILNEKDIQKEYLPELLAPLVGIVDMVRLAIDPQHLSRAVQLSAEVKKYGFEIGFNVMYMSKWLGNTDFIEALGEVDKVADCFYMVDSYGGVFPEDVKQIITLVKSKVQCALGFHGHNNLEMALTNTITALEYGVEFVDATILGMGRGAGNLKTELLLTVLNKQFDLPVDFNALEKAVAAIAPLHKEYEWGTNLPYMISGSNSLPQKDVMDWVTTRFYSFNSIVRALDNQKKKIEDNSQFPVYNFDSSERVMIIGGGPSVSKNIDGILAFLAKDPKMVIIHASSKNAGYFNELPHQQYFCLVGSEGHRLESTLGGLSPFNGVCILPPFPRKMGTYVPSAIADKTFELKEIDFTDKLKDAHTTLALQIAANINPKEVYLVGYDGYFASEVSKKELDLIKENEFLFDIAKNKFEKLGSLTATNYSISSFNNLFYQLSRSL